VVKVGADDTDENFSLREINERINSPTLKQPIASRPKEQPARYGTSPLLIIIIIIIIIIIMTPLLASQARPDLHGAG
jgi:hypothetical protein